jgi:hypothetical protein
MERKFTFDDMKFVAKSERLDDGALQVGIYDAWDECLLTADYPAGAAGAKPAPKKRKAAAPSEEDRAITDLIEQFKQKVADGEIDLA